ncbi:MAG: NAD-dependent succinate-semialdehyde dehydrogenase [Phenylobacterium sp.]|uniref:NAD-dependent succinate-semialdehyde dehydrogenase n=1 Tax=Phenylobacterium sp. TaxID=1871053 RepID=UPI002732B10D|nr:NAD-dependent succinate-semialdehyde dehydrogenase [Phenylobacterium sp.]MDP3749560.1 NAD-dependent succinate-semialdehyde dehydrogenase [Phenylobacterium sp.]
MTPPDTLIRRQAFVGGLWCDALDGRRLAITDPADGSEICEVAHLSREDAKRAIGCAAEALPAWRARPAAERAAFLRRWADLVLESIEPLAKLLTREQGKPLAEARAEIAQAAAFLGWFAEEARRVYGDLIPAPRADRRTLVLKQPVGVVAAITPWNFPAAMVARKVAPALAAGCTLVLKPAPQTPLSALALAVLAEAAGLPPGVLNIIPGEAEPIGNALIDSHAVRKLTFTGSTAVGRQLLARSAATLKRVSLELGGNAPFIVFADADLDAAVEGAIESKFRNSGQTCVCANRLLVEDSIYDAFSARLAARAKALVVAPGLAPGSQQGPLIDQSAVDKVEALIADAVDKGARVLTGGGRHVLGGTFFQPTVLTEATADMQLCQAEIFGPVAPLYRFHTENEAVALADATPFGLASYVYSSDLGRALRVGEALQCGMVGINVGAMSTETAPFGGVKDSGFGREGSMYGIDEYLDLKYLSLDLSAR